MTMLRRLLLISPVLIAGASQAQDAPVQSTIEFGPCHEFIGAYFITEETARQVVPADYQLDVQDNGVTAQVRAITCESISITSEDGTTAEGGRHVVYQLGAAVLPPVQLDANPYLEGSENVTEYHAYAYNTLTSFEPLAEAMTKAGIDGVHYVEDIAFTYEDPNPETCEMITVAGSVTQPEDLAFSFTGAVRDPGTSTTDGCEFGENDITTSERAVWYTDGPFGMAMSDTSVPNSQRLLFNADPTTYQPLAIRYAPTGDVMTALSGQDIGQFAFTMSGLLERGEVFTILRPITEE
ncbi:hypothetical protein [Tateyamaria sp. ANG-S1]|uniref:hypothetical protein n=1 Tax=Tateyamaria sp. ANG-S1 TaxID=1577905 RepID=UPI000582A944|nr:hypothetical protein [Tateyamaria sp. ANG-S1]KIC51360.1 hypothetical protein RA29_05950 [Tateyamaria sp. ANG-S1]